MKKICGKILWILSCVIAYTSMAFIIFFTIVLPIYMDLTWPD